MSRSFFIIIYGLCILIASPAAGQDTLKVMSYNIYHGEHHYQRGESNLQGIADVINEVNPDLVALQEVDSLTGRSATLNSGTPVNQVQKLAELTVMHGYFGKAMSYDGGGYGEGVLSKKPLESHKLMLPIPEGGEPRALLMVQYPIDDRKSLTFGGTHLCHQYPANRVAQTKAINNYFSSVQQPAIIAGDFNFTPQEKPYQFIAKQWLDAAKLADRALPTIPFDNPSRRIDYFFLSKSDWKVINMEVLAEGYSDHMPLVLTLVVQ